MSTYSFETVNVKKELVDILINELPKFGFHRVKVFPSDPSAPSELPCIGINRLDDTEASSSIGDFAGDHYDEETKKYYRVTGTYFNDAYEIRIWLTNANERDQLYLTTKAILIAQRGALVEKGLRNVTLRTGQDQQDTTGQEAPMPIYWSTLTFSSMNPLDVTFEEIAEPITAIPVTNLEGGVLE